MQRPRPRKLRSLTLALAVGGICYAVACGLHTVLTWQFGLFMASQRYWFGWLPTMNSTLGFVIPSILFGAVVYLVLIRTLLLPPVEKWHCRHCGYALQGLSQPRCPECGEEFDPEDPASLADSPHFYLRRWWRGQMLKASVALGLLILIPCAYLAWLSWQANRDMQIAREIGANSLTHPAGPAWLVNLQSKQLSPLLQRVRYLSFLTRQQDDTSLARLKDLPYLREIYFQNTPITNALLRHVQDLHDMEYLGLISTPVDDEGLKYLKDLAGLKGLILWGSPVTGSGFVHLARMQRLQILKLDLTKVTDESLVNLKDLPALQMLTLYGTSITGRTLGALSNLPSLSILDLRQSQLSDEGLAEVAKLSHLDTLILLQTPVTDAALAHLTALPSLRVLSLAGTGITDEGLANLKDMTSLRILHLQKTQVTGSSLQHLGSLSTCLQELNLSATPFDDAGMALLPRLPGLQTLHLERTKVTSAGLAYLQSLSVLGELYLDESQIDQNSLPILKKVVKSPGRLVVIGSQDNPDPAMKQLLDQLRSGSSFSVTYERESDVPGRW